MWFILALLTFAAWGTADLFYKKGTDSGDRYSHLRIVIAVGVVMGLHALIYIFVKKVEFSFTDILLYLPVSSMYILSMALGYAGLRYLELSVSSPIQNSSGTVAALLLLCVSGFSSLTALEYVGVALMAAGVFGLSLIEKRNADKARAQSGEVVDKRYRKGFLAVCFPLLYCVVDALGTFADGLYLDEYGLIGEDAALVAYELTFFICAVLAGLYLKLIKKQRRIMTLPYGRDMLLAAVFETAGQFFYVFAISSNAVITAPIVASYCVLSVVLSRVFLKEKLKPLQYLVIALVFAGILLCGIAEGLAESA